MKNVFIRHKVLFDAVCIAFDQANHPLDEKEKDLIQNNLEKPEFRKIAANRPDVKAVLATFN